MENKPKRGRPRKTVDIPPGIAEGGDASCLNTGDRETSGTGTTAQTNPNGETWSEFVARVEKHHDKSLRTVWHPNPEHEHIPTNHATIKVEKGLVRGQLSNGQYIEL